MNIIKILLVHDGIKILNKNSNHIEDHPIDVEPKILNVDISGWALLHDCLPDYDPSEKIRKTKVNMQKIIKWIEVGHTSV